MTLEIIHPIIFGKYTKHPIKVSRNKNNMFFNEHVNMQPFYKRVLRTSPEHFYIDMYLKRETFLRYKTNIFFSRF